MTKGLQGRNGRLRKGKQGGVSSGGAGRKAKKALSGAVQDDMREMTIFAIWLVAIMGWLAVMTITQPQVSAQPLFNLVMTLGGQVGYFDTVWGVGILMMALMVLDISWEIARSKRDSDD